jgi:hypothetical protein
MARPERFELPTAWFVVFRLKSHISLYYIAFMRLALSNKIGLFGLIRLYLGLFGAIYWTTETVDSLGHESDNYMMIARPFCVTHRLSTQQNGL